MTQAVNGTTGRMTFLEELREQRWDDHRCCHHSRANQALHLLSALCFLATCALILVWEPIAAVLLGGFGAMVSRQVGCFLFEPKGCDAVDHASHEHKERIKVCDDLRSKVVLLSIWGITPLILGFSPSFLGLFEPRPGIAGNLHNLSVIWIVLGAIAVALRTLWLCVTRGLQTGLVWCTRILTDPFHDLTRRAPLPAIRTSACTPP